MKFKMYRISTNNLELAVSLKHLKSKVALILEQQSICIASKSQTEATQLTVVTMSSSKDDDDVFLFWWCLRSNKKNKIKDIGLTQCLKIL